MEAFSVISSIFKSIWNIDEEADEDEPCQESIPLHSLHMPPPQDDGGDSNDEEETEEGEIRDEREYFDPFEIINMDYEYQDGEEYLEESCLRLIVALGHAMIPTAESMVTTARAMIPTFPALDFSLSDLESIDGNADPGEDLSWSIIDQR
ncbi:hypothetical protein ACSS6W_007717 [Trichoderma asperelloides]